MSYMSRGVLLVACLLGMGQVAWADGGMFPTFAGSAASADQRAVVVFDSGRETLILQTTYEGDSANFAWVIPTPVRVMAGDIATADASIFDDLYYLTEPHVWGPYGYNGGLIVGCGGGARTQQFGSVNVWDTLHVDDYEVAILSAGESSDLVTWLNNNGYAYPAGHQGELDYYVGKAWFFVAAKINPARRQDGNPVDPPGLGDGQYEGDEMDPLRLRFDTPEPVFPLRISAASSKAEVEVLLYVIHRHRVISHNFNTQEVKLSSPFKGGDFAEYYEREFRNSLAEAGAGSLLVEYAGELPRYLANAHATDLGVGEGTFYLTRLRTYLQPDEMQEDVGLAQAPSDESFEVWVATASLGDGRVRLAVVGLLLVLGCVLGIASGDRDKLIRALLAAAVIALLII